MAVPPPPGFHAFVGGFPSSFDTSEEYKLENTWCFWHDKFIGPGASASEYEASLHKLVNFNSVQDFWKCFNNLPPVNKLQPKSSFHLMKEGIPPLWEDPTNAEGGFWAFRVKKSETAYVWKELVLALIGEQFEPVLLRGDSICGLTVSIRTHDDTVRLWTKNAEDQTPAHLTKLRELLPKVEIRNPYYKANKEHRAFNPELREKKKVV
ncbi:mRNA cap-binding protein [Balamuthia mandrillaris]